MSDLMPPTALAEIRAMVDRWLVDTLEVWRGESSTHDDATLTEEHVPGAMLWSGKGRVRPTRGPREMAVPEGVAVLRDCDILFSLEAPALRRDDEIRVVTAADPSIEGRWFRVTDVRVFSQQASRKVSAVQIQASRLWPGVPNG